MSVTAHIVRLLFAITLLFTTLPVSGATAFKNETLHYVISYKWGLIHKDAGEATLSLRQSGNNYNVMLAARTKPWADKVYMVRDTLLSTIRMNALVPLKYEKITREKGKYGRDVITYSKSGNTTTGYCKRYKEKNGKVSESSRNLSATGPVYDMLSVFYYLRQLDYDRLSKNKAYQATVFSGSKKETVTIRSLGIEKIKLRNKTTHRAYHVKFNFTQEGGKKSSDDIDVWISTDSSHVPLYLTAGLPIGQVRAYLIP
ncbi:MAG: DUF3108 domain-containing protein [Candidatus Amulumruptor caecigallinarius]|nr:DUF3108 domain-containing protein [Candidatus Amulumruptor caecigallinarius]